MTYVRKLSEEFRKLKRETEPLKSELICTQKQVISLQSELLSSKSEQILEIKSSVKNSVEESVQAGFVSYSSVLQSIKTAVAPETVKTVVKTVLEEEDRSQSVMIFGLCELPNENLADKVSEVFENIGEKPRFEARRIGKTNENKSNKSVRPVKVTLSNTSIVNQLVSRAKILRQSESHKNVFISRDRSPEERIKLRELVMEMKQRAKDEPNKRHFIKGGIVCSQT